MTIGVFDSGVGGKHVAYAIKRAMPEHEVLLREDKANLPYGTKTSEELLRLVAPILQSMVDDSCQVIVVACNTVTTNIISELRSIIDAPLIGIEPMIKPASELTKSRVVTVFATPATLKSVRYNLLKAEFAEGMKVIEPDCSDWAYLIENNRANELNIKSDVDEGLNAGADIFVLACTHYHWIENEIKKLVGSKGIVIQPEAAIISRLEQIIKEI